MIIECYDLLIYSNTRIYSQDYSLNCRRVQYYSWRTLDFLQRR